MAVPSLRFREFEGEWRTKEFGECYEFISTNSFSRDLLNYEEGEVYNIHYGDIHTKFELNFNLDKERVPLINSDVDLSKYKDEKYCKNGDLVIADASEDYSDIGKTIELVDLNDKLVLAGLHTFLARRKVEFADGFMSQLLKSWTSRWQIMRIAQGTRSLVFQLAGLVRLK